MYIAGILFYDHFIVCIPGYISNIFPNIFRNRIQTLCMKLRKKRCVLKSS